MRKLYFAPDPRKQHEFRLKDLKEMFSEVKDGTQEYEFEVVSAGIKQVYTSIENLLVKMTFSKWTEHDEDGEESDVNYDVRIEVTSPAIPYGKTGYTVMSFTYSFFTPKHLFLLDYWSDDDGYRICFDTMMDTSEEPEEQEEQEDSNICSICGYPAELEGGICKHCHEDQEKDMQSYFNEIDNHSTDFEF